MENTGPRDTLMHHFAKAKEQVNSYYTIQMSAQNRNKFVRIHKMTHFGSCKSQLSDSSRISQHSWESLSTKLRFNQVGER